MASENTNEKARNSTTFVCDAIKKHSTIKHSPMAGAEKMSNRGYPGTISVYLQHYRWVLCWRGNTRKSSTRVPNELLAITWEDKNIFVNKTSNPIHLLTIAPKIIERKLIEFESSGQILHCWAQEHKNSWKKVHKLVPFVAAIQNMMKYGEELKNDILINYTEQAHFECCLHTERKLIKTVKD